MNTHNITSARYSTESTAIDAPVIAIRFGREESRRANDDIEGGGMVAYIAGGGVIDPFVAPPITVAEVKAESRRRILDRYPMWKQMNLTREGGDGLVEMGEYIDAVRAASDALEISLPTDFASDVHWPE